MKMIIKIYRELKKYSLLKETFFPVLLYSMLAAMAFSGITSPAFPGILCLLAILMNLLFVYGEYRIKKHEEFLDNLEFELSTFEVNSQHRIYHLMKEILKRDISQASLSPKVRDRIKNEINGQ